MQVCNLAERLVSAGSVSHVGRGQSPDHENDGCGHGEHPSHMETAARFRGNTLLQPFPEVSTRRKSSASHLNRALQLHAREGIGGAGGAIAHMRVESSHLLLRNLSVQVGVELSLPGFTNHGSSPLQFVVLLLVANVAAIDSVKFAAHVINGTSRYRWEPQASRKSLGT